MKAVENRSNSKYTDSDIFESGLAIKYGVKRVGLDTSSVIPRVKSYTVDWKNFRWDLNAREYDIKIDALWEAEVEKLPRVYLESIYGKDAISIVSGQTSSGFPGRPKKSYYVSYQKDANNPLPYDMISLFKHCQKVSRVFYYVLFADSANVHGLNTPLVGKYKSFAEANQILKELNISNILAVLLEEGQVF